MKQNLAASFTAGNNVIDAGCNSLLTKLATAMTNVNIWLGGQQTVTADALRQRLDQETASMLPSIAPDEIAPCSAAYEQAETFAAARLADLKKKTKEWLDKNKAQQLSFAGMFTRDAQVSDFYTLKALYGIDRGAPLTFNANGSASFNKNDSDSKGAKLKSLRDYSVEVAFNSQRKPSSTSTSTTRRRFPSR